MARFKYSNRILLFPIMIGLPLVACDRDSYHYAGDALSVPRPWLKNKRIFLYTGFDSGTRHNPTANDFDKDDIAIRVTGMLAEMLQGAGVIVETTQGTASDIEITRIAFQFSPDLIIGIRPPASHGTTENPSRPLILLGGPRDIHAPGFDFAVILMDEFHKIMDGEGIIAPETTSPGGKGTILRDSASLCPGVVGIPASYPGIDTAHLSVQVPYLQKLAEAYFSAVSTYTKRGIPTSKVSFSCPVETAESGLYVIREATPSIIIHTDAGGEAPGIDESSLHITLDGLPLKHEKISETQYRVAYGTRIYPGRHSLRYRFKNLRGQSSMTHDAAFALPSQPGDRERLIREGAALLGKQGQKREGLAMLLSALSHGIAFDGIEDLFRSIIHGFNALGNAPQAAYYKNALSSMQRVGRDSLARKPFPSPGTAIFPLNSDAKPASVISGHCEGEKANKAPHTDRNLGILDIVIKHIPIFNLWPEGK